MENLRTEVDLKEKDFSRLSSVVGAVEQSINSVSTACQADQSGVSNKNSLLYSLFSP